MKKNINKIARHGRHHKTGLGIGLGYYDSHEHSPYYAYPSIVMTVHKIPPVYIKSGDPIIWKPRLLHDKYSPVIPPIVIKIAADYIGRFI
ncbi:MAG: hypothetical protein WCP96_15865 [Methylococcaceae bacterium]